MHMKVKKWIIEFTFLFVHIHTYKMHVCVCVKIIIKGKKVINLKVWRYITEDGERAQGMEVEGGKEEDMV